MKSVKNPRRVRGINTEPVRRTRPKEHPTGRTLNASTLITLTEAVGLIADRMHESKDTPRQTRDKIRKRLRYAIREGHIAPTSLNGHHFKLGVIGAWARSKSDWASRLADLPRTVVVSPASSANVQVIGSNPLAHVQKADLDSSAAQLRAATSKIFELEQELKAAKIEIERLTPLASRYEQTREKLRASARKKRS